MSLGVAMAHEPEAQEPGLQSIAFWFEQTPARAYKKLSNAW